MVIERPESQEPRFASALDRRSPIPPPMRAPMPTISIDVDVEWERETQEIPAALPASLRVKLESRDSYDALRWRRVPPDPASRIRRWLSDDE